MRILFYIPVVTPWWFTEIVVPLIRAATRGAEVHVMVPPLWSGTGIDAEQLAGCADLSQVFWHILEGEQHPQIRTSARGLPDLLDLVRAIDPDLCLCRSADIETPALFPGMVRYIMEGGAPPFATDPTAVYLSHSLFDHGLLPELAPAEQVRLADAIAATWKRIERNSARMERDAFLRAAGLPSDRLLIGLPLEYEHEEMFFGQHSPYGDNVALIEMLAPNIGDDSILVVTNHPLNEIHADNSALRETIARYAGKVKLLGQVGAPGEATMLLARHCDGMVVGNSKSFGNCAFFGTPILRLSKFATGDWMQAYQEWEPFIADLREGKGLGADEEQARRWFAFHLANNVFDPADPALDAAALADRALHAMNSDRWDAGFFRHFGITVSAPPVPSAPKESLCHV